MDMGKDGLKERQGVGAAMVEEVGRKVMWGLGLFTL